MIAKTDRTIKAEFDPTFKATALGGLVLPDRLAQRVGVWRILGEELAARGGRYECGAAASQLILGLLAGGRGLSAGEVLRGDTVLDMGLGWDSVAEESTMNRVLAELAGLPQRKEADVYEKKAPNRDLWGEEDRRRGTRLVKGIEYADEKRLTAAYRASDRIAAALLSCMGPTPLRYGRWIPIFGDGNQLEVTGRCFDAACLDRNGNLSLHLAFTFIGPLFAATELRPGTKDEGLGMPPLLDRTLRIVESAGLSGEPLLFLLDSAFGEDQVLRKLHAMPSARYIVGVNGMRQVMTRMCLQQPASQWKQETRLEPWLQEASYCAFTYRADTWERNETVVAIRYKEKKDLVEKFTFVLTNLEPAEVNADRRRLGASCYQATIWSLYRHKQGMENYQKPAVSDLGLHHPPSGRFGINQVFYALATIAFNLAAAISHAALPKEERGMRLWRMRRSLFYIPALVTTHARQVTVRLATSIPESRQVTWMACFAKISRW